MMGAKALVKSLLINNSITCLNVWANPMTVEGVCMILQSVVGNGVCQIVATNCLADDDEALMLKEILHMRKKRRQ